MRRTILVLVGFLLLSGPLLGQGNPTGVLGGRVTADGGPLPGVQVTVSSESLQGTRTTMSTASGDYIFRGLPPGNYEVSFDMDGFQSQRVQVVLSAAQAKTFDTEMTLSEVTEEIVVTGNQETLSEGTTSSTTYSQETIEKLAVPRTLDSAVLLAPSVHNTGPGRDQDRDVISISGGQTFENLVTINGVVVNENLRGQSLDLFIEDAIQETTTSTSGISAEYGRFTGGVVNAITKSGGNKFSGSLRANLRNQDWESKTPLTGEQEDNIEETWEATLGGYFVKDRLWFFAAGRTLDRSRQEQLQTGLNYPSDRTQDRLEGKLTARLAEGHSILGSYIDIEDEQTNNDPFGIALELNSLSDRSDPQTLLGINYTGVVTQNFFVEAQYSERELSLAKGAGATGEGLIDGTHLIDQQLSSATYYIPYFCDCTFDDRDNESKLVKGSYFASSEKGGAHDITFGYDSFSSLTATENHQSPSGFSIWTDTSIDRNGQIFPVVSPGVTFIIWFPIENPTKGADFTTNSFFVNDRWSLNDHWSFNLGLRYDINDGVDSGGAKVADDSNLSPRLGVNYDLKADGDIVLNASYAEYVSAVNFGVGDVTATAGTYSIFYYDYLGPAINPDPSAANLTTSREALQIMFDWFESQGGTDSTDLLFGAFIPGGSEIIPTSLDSPKATEYSIGATKRLGSKGMVRGDLVYRDFSDFYFVRRDLTTGSNEELFVDVGHITNDSDLLTREYSALNLQFSYRPTDRLSLAGNYTLSQAKGNFEGENRDVGPFPGDFGEYPEYKAFPQHNPSGDLAIDSRHRLNFWAIYDVLQGDRHHLSVSLLERFNTGTPYGAHGQVNSGRYIDNPGYLVPPNRVDYWFTARDAFRTPDVSSTDLALNYSFNFGRGFEVFIQPEIINVFNESSEILVNETVLDATNSADFESFNPFTEAPVQGVHWDFDERFGQALRDTRFQQPRTFRFSVGFRF